MSGSIVILGTGGTALDIMDVIEAVNARARTWTVVGFLDDSRSAGGEYLGLPILGRLDEATRLARHAFINAIGSDRSFRDREAIVARTGLGEDRFAILVHPSSSVSARARLGRGTVVNFGTSVGGGAVIGAHVMLGPGCIIGHDSAVEDYVVLAPGAVVSGSVRLGRGCYLGARATVRQDVRVGSGALLGMGAVVLHDVGEGQTVVGNPARPLASGRPAGGL